MTAVDPRRVLLVVDAFPDAARPSNGIFLYDQARALAARVDVGVAIARTCSPRQWFSRGGARSPDMTRKVDGFMVWTNESFVPTTRSTRLLVQARCRSVDRAVRSFERRFGRPDVIHAHCAAFAGETAVRIGRRLGIPVVITEHYSFLAELVARYGERLLKVYDAADAVLAVSHSQVRRMIALGVRRPVRVVPNAVDARAFSFTPIAAPADGVWKILCVARDHDVKDLPTLLQAVSRLGGIRFELSIAGPGDYRRARAVSEGLGLGDRVRFLGELTRPELACVVKASHVVVSSSRTETFGMSLAESLCAGRPVVTTDSGGPRDIVRPKDGRTVPVADPIALAEAICEMVAHYDGFDQAELSRSARERFGPDAFVTQTLAVYEDVLARCEDGARRNRPGRSMSRLDGGVLCGSRA